MELQGPYTPTKTEIGLNNKNNLSYLFCIKLVWLEGDRVNGPFLFL